MDVVIIGGGPAGSTVGTALQKKGYSTCIIDKSVFPRQKLCAGVVTAKSVKCINEVYSDLDIDSLKLREIHDIELLSDNISIGKYVVNNPFRIADRTHMDNEFISYYKNVGGTLYEGQKNYKINYKDNLIVLEDGTTLNYKVLIGAEGVNSNVRHYVSKPWQKAGLGYQTFISNTNEEATIQIYFEKNTEGYFWRIPAMDQVAIGMGEAYKKGDKKTVDKHLHFFEEQGVTDTKSIKGYFYSSGDYVKNPVKNNVLLIGEAAGFVDIITGEGIYFALESGRQAAIAIDDYFKNNTNLKSYTKNIKFIFKKIDEQILCSKLVYSPLIKNKCFKLMQQHPNAVVRVIETAISTYESGYADKKTLSRILRQFKKM